MMELQYGKCYLNRMGVKIGPLYKSPSRFQPNWPFSDGEHTYNNFGLKAFDHKSQRPQDLITLIEDPMTPIEQKIADVETTLGDIRSSAAEMEKKLVELKEEYAESLKPKVESLKHWDVVENLNGHPRICIQIGDKLHIYRPDGSIQYRDAQHEANNGYLVKSSRPFTVQQ